MKTKILIDLDVVTVSIWNKSGKQVEIANSFIERVKKREFHVITPFFLLEIVSKWKHERLKQNIKEFYLNHSYTLLTDTAITYQINNKKIYPNKILPEMIGIGIKDEDAFLVFVGSLFSVDYLVTFNRKHLKNNADKINDILRRYKFNEIKIVLPNEI